MKFHIFSYLIHIELVLPPRQLSVAGSELTNEIMAEEKPHPVRHALISVCMHACVCTCVCFIKNWSILKSVQQKIHFFHFPMKKDTNNIIVII